MRRLLNTTTIAILSLVLPMAALANVSGTLTLSANQILNLDTGTVVATGGDILWNGSTITPQGSATALTAAMISSSISGQSAFDALTQLELTLFSSKYSPAPVPASALALNDIFAVYTNGGNYAAVLVTGQSGTSITIEFVTFESGTTASGPTITQVLNNYGLVPAGFSNSGIALGSLFIIKGSGLASATSVSSQPCALPCTTLQSSASPGLPNTLNGASVKVTVNGTTTVPVFYYAIDSQLALVMPSSTPIGAGTVTVTYNNQTTAPYNIQVVASAMGFDTYNGLGVATDPATGALFTPTNPIAPGTTVVLWGSGLGADPTRDTTFVGAAFSINSLANIYVGGVAATIQYQGASGYPGVNQVNLLIPANAPTGCNVALVGVSSAGVPSNFVTVPIGSGPCADPALGISGGTVSTLKGKATVNTGFVFLDQSTAPPASGGSTSVTDAAIATFQSYTGSSYSTAGSGTTVSIGGCIVEENVTGGSAGTTTGLNAGAITVSGPNGSATLMSGGAVLPGLYEAQLASGFIPASGGSFVVNGGGGSNIGPFTTTINYPNPVLTWTNQSAAATIARSSGVTVNWTGGSSGTFVVISGNSSSGSASGGFTCNAPVGAGTFQVPGYVLEAMPAGSGGLTVSNYTNYTSFTATGLDYGIAAGFVTYEASSTYQ